MHSAPPEKAWRLGKGPFIFSGTPPACTGSLELENITDQKVKIRAIPAVSDKKEHTGNIFTEARLVASIKPRTSIKVPAHFQIRQDTPSGIYKSSLSCGKQREEVIIHVFDNYNYTIEPDRIFMRGSAGATLSQSAIITNTGNVTIELPEVSVIWFEEQDWIGRTFVYALRESTEGEGYQKFLDRVMGEFRSEMIASTRVKVDSKPGEIKPGMIAQVLLTVMLPKELKKGRTYVGFMKIPGRRLWFEIECIGAINSEKRRK